MIEKMRKAYNSDGMMDVPPVMFVNAVTLRLLKAWHTPVIDPVLDYAFDGCIMVEL